MSSSSWTTWWCCWCLSRRSISHALVVFFTSKFKHKMSSSAATIATIVVPTYMEKENLKPLIQRVFAALKAKGYAEKSVELIVVDDNSRDGSAEVVAQMTKEGYNARIIVRTTERGLSSAVLRGFHDAAPTSRYLICMDADLQHPPEKVPELLKALVGGAPFVLGTRYAVGTVVDKDWPLYRRVISSGARMLARPLTPLSDPMSGFFGMDAALFRRTEPTVNPVGFKIALELFVKSHCTSSVEIGIDFGVRVAGESKLTGKVILNYIQHLAELYRFKFPLLLPLLFVIVAIIIILLFKRL